MLLSRMFTGRLLMTVPPPAPGRLLMTLPLPGRLMPGWPMPGVPTPGRLMPGWLIMGRFIDAAGLKLGREVTLGRAIERDIDGPRENPPPPPPRMPPPPRIPP